MKYLITVYLILIYGCTIDENYQNTDCLTLLVDKTDEFTSKNELTIKNISKYLNVFNANQNDGAQIKISPITDLRFNKSISIKIPSVRKNEINELERINEVDSFKTNLVSSLDQVLQIQSGINGSAIFESIGLNINEMANCQNCQSKTLIVSSDFRQLNSNFNSYDKTQILKFQSDSIFANSILDITLEISKNIDGIKIVFLHQPNTQNEDNSFYIITKVLKDYLEQKGAIVSIQTSL